MRARKPQYRRGWSTGAPSAASATRAGRGAPPPLPTPESNGDNVGDVEACAEYWGRWPPLPPAVAHKVVWRAMHMRIWGPCTLWAWRRGVPGGRRRRRRSDPGPGALASSARHTSADFAAVYRRHPSRGAAARVAVRRWSRRQPSACARARSAAFGHARDGGDGGARWRKTAMQQPRRRGSGAEGALGAWGRCSIGRRRRRPSPHDQICRPRPRRRLNECPHRPISLELRAVGPAAAGEGFGAGRRRRGTGAGGGRPSARRPSLKLGAANGDDAACEGCISPS